MHALTLIVMTRLPREGRNKTRLIPALGAKGAMDFHDRLARHSIATATAFCEMHQPAKLVIWLAGGSPAERRAWLGPGAPEILEQVPGDLGARMEAAASHSFSKGADRVVIIGTDCPSIDGAVLARAFDELATNDLVFGPALDGGYYLIGMNRHHPSVFRDIPWGTEHVLEKSLSAACAAGLSCTLLDPLPDVDLPKDIPAAESILSASGF